MQVTVSNVPILKQGLILVSNFPCSLEWDAKTRAWTRRSFAAAINFIAAGSGHNGITFPETTQKAGERVVRLHCHCELQKRKMKFAHSGKSSPDKDKNP